MNIAVIGLGLIGGSIAKGLKHSTPHTVLGTDILPSVIKKAVLFKAIDDELSPDMLTECDVVIVALYPDDCINYIKDNAKKFKKDAIVLDCAGVKTCVCNEIFPLAKELGFHFIGAHPMAGIEYSGFDNSGATLFNNASIILTPPSDVDIDILQKVKKLFGSIGFTGCEICTPEHHDRIIAYTSQLAHVVSSAFIKSPTAQEHHGFSAGSYRDMTRVAHLKADMWCELFLSNSEYLTQEIDVIIKNLTDYREVIKNQNEELLLQYLRDGTRIKEKADIREMK